jgi:hypothetical protein
MRGARANANTHHVVHRPEPEISLDILDSLHPRDDDVHELIDLGESRLIRAGTSEVLYGEFCDGEEAISTRLSCLARANRPPTHQSPIWTCSRSGSSLSHDQ